jgi:hypothetical protein
MWQWFFLRRHIFAVVVLIFFVYWLFFLYEGIYRGIADYVLLASFALFSFVHAYQWIKKPERRWRNFILFVFAASMTVKEILLIFCR